ncbi:MAG: cache domain-containing protein [Bdellovibrionales bacterium]
MGNLLARVKINIRIYMLMAVAALGIIGVIGIAAYSIEGSLTKAKQTETESLADTALSVAHAYQQRAKSGEFSEEEAQKRALETIASLRYDKTNYFFVLGWDGTMLGHPKKEIVGTDVLGTTDADGNYIFRNMIEASKTEVGVVSYMWKDTDGKIKLKISHVAGMPDWKWAVGTGIYADDIARDVLEVEKHLGIVAGGLLLIAIFIANMIGRSITKPIDQLNSSMQQLAGGDTSGEVGMEDRRDEIGTMANTVRVFQENARQVAKLKSEQAEMERRAAADKKTSMNKLADDFEHSVGQIVQVVASAATELQANSKHLSDIADQTSRQSATVAAATEEASSSVSTVASATEELSASIGEINRQITESSQVAQNAVKEVKKTDETVSTLSEAAAQIGDVVKLIQDIAEQTNLLALNATIEAARAGEAGKGFAVVASEVKNLANQTARATEDISKKIVTVQNVSTDTVSAIRSIGKTIEQMNTITTAIANAIQEQTAATKEISNNVQQASAGTSEVTSNIVVVTQASSEARGAASEVLSASSELSKQSEHLRTEIDGFLRKVREA